MEQRGQDGLSPARRLLRAGQDQPRLWTSRERQDQRPSRTPGARTRDLRRFASSSRPSRLPPCQGEMHYRPRSSFSSFGLPRAGGVAYVPQEPWLLSCVSRRSSSLLCLISSCLARPSATTSSWIPTSMKSGTRRYALLALLHRWLARLTGAMFGQVVFACGLRPDLDSMAGGDATEVKAFSRGHLISSLH